jgi:hypothetical protein
MGGGVGGGVGGWVGEREDRGEVQVFEAYEVKLSDLSQAQFDR